MSSDAHQNYITKARQLAQQVWNGITALQDMQLQWNAGDYGNNLEAGINANEGITKAQVGAVVFDTADALYAVLNSGHGGNLEKLL